MFSDLLGLAWRNMQQSKVRLLMTSGGMLVGTAAVMLLVALTIGLQRIAEENVGGDAVLKQILVLPSRIPLAADDRPALDDDALETLRSLSGVETVVPIVYLSRRVEIKTPRYRNYATVYGVRSEDLHYLGLVPESGQLILPDDNAIIFGNTIVQNFTDPQGQSYEAQTIDIYDTNLELTFARTDGNLREIRLEPTALLEPHSYAFDTGVIMSLDGIVELNEWTFFDQPPQTVDAYNQVVVKTTSRRVTQSVRDLIENIGYNMDSNGQLLDEINQFFNAMRLIFGLTGGIALLVAAFVVANTMIMSVVERISAIGLMKAIGARDRDVLTIFLVEASLVGLGGGIGGVITALLLGNGINRTLRNLQGSNIEVGGIPLDTSSIPNGELIIIPLTLMLFAIVLATIVGFCAGFFPAWYAARLSTVTALKR